MPAPRWKVTAWLSAPAHPATPEVATKLRMSMFRRLGAVLVSAVVTPFIAFLAVSRHPEVAFKIWFVLDLALLVFRVSVVVHVVRRQKYDKIGWLFGPIATDLFVLAGTAWCALYGFGSLLVMMTSDGPLMMTATFAGSAILGAICARNPGSPRLNSVHVSLILVPFSIGCFLSATPLIAWYILLGPVYLLTLMSMTRQIHDDYVAMIVAQLENRQRALHCSLTGLPNRSFFYERLGESLDALSTSTWSLAILSIDLDGFKAVNDDYGHPLGDVLLRQVGDRLRSLIRDAAIVARLGGDEFAILTTSGTLLDAERLAARINHLIAEPFVLSPRVTVTIGASVGIVDVIGETHVEANDVMARADQALYAAKRAGKGTFRRSGITTVSNLDSRTREVVDPCPLQPAC